MAKANPTGIFKITKEGIGKALEDIKGLLETHAADIGQAYINCDNEISVSLGIKFKPSKGAGETDMVTSIAFTKEKIMDSVKTTLDPNQRPLFK